MLEAVIVVLAGGGMTFAGVQAVTLGAEIQRDKLNGAGQALKRAYGPAAQEPIPDDMQELLGKLGGITNEPQN